MGVELVSNILAYHGSADVLTRKTQQDATQSANANASIRNAQNINKIREVKPSENEGKGARLGVNKDKMFKQGRKDGGGVNDSPGSRLDILI